MKAHILQHVSFEGPAYIGQWLTARGAQISHTRFWESSALPNPATVDLLVVMGGPMSVNDEAEFAWLAAEKRFIAEVVARGRPVLGICLGAQLIASAYGARVFRNTEKEIGWFDVHACTGAEDAFDFPPTTTVLHWHAAPTLLVVSVRRGDGQLTIQVAHDARSRRRESELLDTPGWSDLRERAVALLGQLQAGTGEAGGFELITILPWPLDL